MMARCKYKDIKNIKTYPKSEDSRLEAEILRPASRLQPRPVEKAWGQKSNEVEEIIRPVYVISRSQGPRSKSGYGNNSRIPLCPSFRLIFGAVRPMMNLEVCSL